MTFDEFDKEAGTVIPQSIEEAGIYPLRKLPSHQFIMSDENGMAYYATVTEDGRIVPIDEYYWD